MRYILNLLLSASLFIGILSAGFAHAATATVSYLGNNTYAITGKGLKGVSALDITIDYDSAVLSNPRATAGFLSKDAMFVANPNTRGRLILTYATLSPISGDGTLATIIFDNNGSGAGKILAFTLEAHDALGKRLSVEKSIGAQPESTSSSQPDQGGNNPDPSPSTVSQSASNGAKVPMGVGLVNSQPGDETPRGEGEKAQALSDLATDPQPDVHTPPEQPDTSRLSEDSGTVATNTGAEQLPKWNPPAIKSILNRFRDYKGEKSPKSLMALFVESKAPLFRQEPAIVLSNGTNQVTVHIEIPKGKQAPNFALQGAKLVSLRSSGDLAWTVIICPDANVVEAAISVLLDGNLLVVPVTVAPPVAYMQNNKKTLNEAAFSRFLKDRGTDKAPLGDLNNDGRRDYVDDYIYTCNYL